MSDKPMTAEEIRRWWHNGLRLSLAPLIDHLLDWMSAREREHAELLARFERREKEGDDGR